MPDLSWGLCPHPVGGLALPNPLLCLFPNPASWLVILASQVLDPLPRVCHPLRALIPPWHCGDKVLM